VVTDGDFNNDNRGRRDGSHAGEMLTTNGGRGSRAKNIAPLWLTCVKQMERLTVHMLTKWRGRGADYGRKTGSNWGPFRCSDFDLSLKIKIVQAFLYRDWNPNTKILNYVFSAFVM
jgi:hypothetical protein